MKRIFNQLGRGLAVAALLAAASFVAGCASTGSGTAYQPPPTMAQQTYPPVSIPQNAAMPTNNMSTPPLRVGDLVIIEWFDTPTPIQPYKDRVRDDGNLVLPNNIVVRAVGLTAGQLQDEIHKAYVPRLYYHLTVSVKTEERFYFVDGEVKVPNRQYYYGDMTVLRAISTAGGFTDFADRGKIELRRSNGESHMINYKKAMKNSKLDMPVFPNDQVIVHKRFW
jgi:protein involved in polysaccharide export with SLBB domain